MTTGTSLFRRGAPSVPPVEIRQPSSGEFGQFGSKREEFEAYRAYLKSIDSSFNTSLITFNKRNSRFSSLYQTWVETGRPTTPGGLTPLAQRGIRESGLEELVEATGVDIPGAPGPTPQQQLISGAAAVTAGRTVPLTGQAEPQGETVSGTIRPLPGETAAEYRARIGTQLRVLGDPVQEIHLGRSGFWNAQGQFVSTNQFGEQEIIDFEPSRRAPLQQQVAPTELTPFQKAQQEQSQKQFEATQRRLTAQTEADQKFRESQFKFQQQQLEADQLFREQQLTSQREERLAQLAANPISWLQHAALSGQTPVVQPWMIPLMRPGQNLQIGQPIPGFQSNVQSGLPGAALEGPQGGFLPGSATPAPVGNQFANLPELRRPSAQLFSRFGPTAQRQFLGFRQARTGIPPEEALFRQRQAGPPGAARGALQQQRLRV